jgi:hypothetical protein
VQDWGKQDEIHPISPCESTNPSAAGGQFETIAMVVPEDWAVLAKLKSLDKSK